MIWLTLAFWWEVGELIKMGQEGSCKVCNARALETIKQAFSSYETLEGM
jgi:hypothetical protein